MKYRVRLSHRAAREAEAIYRYVCQDGSEHGQRWYNGLVAELDSLASLPERCPIARSVSTERDVVRQLEYGRKPHIYRIYFRVRDDLVEILHIRHRARRPVRRRDLSKN